VEEILSLKDSFLQEAQSVTKLSDLQLLKVKYLGKKGLVTSKLKTLSAVSPELRRAYGKAINDVKDSIEVKSTG
jgi:phenylalanyl-tRNA synthetase alpha chain